MVKRESSYDIPAAPPPPKVPLDFAEPYERNRGMGDPERGGSQRAMRRSGSLAHRLGSRIMGSVRRSRTSARWRSSRIEQDEDYRELDEREEAIGFDVSTFGPEFAVPSEARKAMEEHQFEDMAYTGTGEVYDLSNLTGFDTPTTENFGRVQRQGTIENTSSQSFYFSPGRVIPNWKPIVLQTWYLIGFIILTIAMIAAVEYLYYVSDRHKIREGGGLFAYVIIDDLSVLQFAIWKYVPTVVGVLYGILWKVTDEELKRSEPYYQLSKGSTGALAAESLNIEYHTVWSPMVPYAALKYRQFVVAAGGFINFLASSAVPIFLSVLIRVDPSQKERQKMAKDGKDISHLTKRLVVDSLWTRLLEVTLAAIVICAIYIVWKLTHRRSGLLGDPSGIAGVAAMANKSHILMDFADLDLASEEVIHKQLNKRTYILHKGALWQAQALKKDEIDMNGYIPKAQNPHPLLLRTEGVGPFLAFIFSMLVVLPFVVYNNTANVVIDKAPWVITGISILIKSIWELLEKEMRILEPFWLLYKRHADSSVLTLDYTATIPGFIIFKALSNGHLLLAWVTFVTVLIEILTVVLGSLDAQGGEESNLSSLLSFILAIIIFVIVLFTGAIVLKKRRRTFLPRQPGTISSVLAFIHQSKMLTDFDGTEQQSTAERKEKLRGIGNRYGFGWFVGRDGNRHLGIDKEPLLEGFKFGRDTKMAVVEGPGEWEHLEGRRGTL
ncbi:hypothetical protein FPQ18DRAFT_264345 [Pyronema domesticum]|nr:hypothetical protein FPQ18DRAFT_264345 [Pyronema domesticum]